MSSLGYDIAKGVYTAGKGVVDTILEHTMGDANPKAKGLAQTKTSSEFPDMAIPASKDKTIAAISKA